MPGTIIQRQTNPTGNTVDDIIAPGATGADTITTSSAAGGNAGQPERAIPQGSVGGGGGGGSSRYDRHGREGRPHAADDPRQRSLRISL